MDGDGDDPLRSRGPPNDRPRLLMPTNITLYGNKEARFQEIRDALEEEWGYRPDRPEVVGWLMGNVSTDALDSKGV